MAGTGRRGVPAGQGHVRAEPGERGATDGGRWRAGGPRHVRRAPAPAPSPPPPPDPARQRQPAQDQLDGRAVGRREADPGPTAAATGDRVARGRYSRGRWQRRQRPRRHRDLGLEGSRGAVAAPAGDGALGEDDPTDSYNAPTSPCAT